MPLGKYYCDYCEKQFQDTPFARKRHLQSLSHHRAKALWFDSFRGPPCPCFFPFLCSFFFLLIPFLADPNQAFTDGFGTGVCNRFLRTGFCQYGDSCKYFHPKNNPQNSSPKPIAGFPETNPAPNIPVNEFVEGNSLTGNLVSNRMGTSWGNLPPSLMPPPEGGYPPLPFVDWG